MAVPTQRTPKLSVPQVIAFAGTFFFFLLIYIVGPDFILPSQSRDAETVADMAMRLDDVSDGSGGYYYTALILSYLPPGGDQLIVVAVATLFIATIFYNIRSLPISTLAFFICITPILMFLFAYIKDTFTPILTALCLMSLRSRRPLAVRLTTVLLLYIAYGIYFRQYYLLITGVFVALTFFRISNWYLKLVLLLLAIAAFMLLPDSYFYELGNARDNVNRVRSWSDSAGYRTAFFNIVPTEGALSFAINYAYAILRLNFPIIFTQGIKEIFLMVNLGIYAFFIRIGLRSKNEAVILPALLFISHMLVLNIFEPDLGSYLRHASSALLYLVPALTVFDQRFRGSSSRSRRRPRARQVRSEVRLQR